MRLQSSIMMMVYTSTISLVDHYCDACCDTTVRYQELKELKKAKPHIPHKHMFGSNHPGSSHCCRHKNHICSGTSYYIGHLLVIQDILTTYTVAIIRDVPTTTNTQINHSGSFHHTFVTQSNIHNTQLELTKAFNILIDV